MTRYDKRFGGVVSAELLFPDCQHCGSPGALVTAVETSPHLQGDFRCIVCEEPFDPPAGSEWVGVMGLDEPLRTAYIDVEIRGLTIDEYRQGRGLKFYAARDRYREARDAIGDIRAQQTAATTVAVGGD